MIKTNEGLLNNLAFFLILFLPLGYLAGNAVLNILLILISLLFLISISFYKNLDFYQNKFLLILSLFFLYIFINFFFFNYTFNNFLSSIGILRFFFVAIAIPVFVNINIKKINYLRIFYLIVTLFVILDVIFQYIFGYDIFGYSVMKINYIQPDTINNIRISGPFGKELIAGTFLSTIGNLSIILNYTYLNKFKFLNISFFFYALTLNFITIILTGDRSPLLIILYSLIFLIILSKKNRYFFIKCLIISVFIFSIFFIFSSKTQYRYYNNIGSILSYDNLNNKSNFVTRFKDTPWGSHYLVSLELIKEKPLFGHGSKSFRDKCVNYDNIDSKSVLIRCTTHPHNSTLEILVENGLFGLILFFIFVYIVIIEFLKNYKYYNLEKAFILSLVLAVIFPLKPTGSFFSSWYGSIMWILFGFYFLINKTNIKK
jgi:O-antigen ligase